MNLKLKNNNYIFFAVWGLFAFALFYNYFENKVHYINSTMFAFSYKYGFVSRGLLGSIYAAINKITPFDMMNYHWVLRFNQAVFIILMLVVLFFFIICVKKASVEVSDNVKYIIMFFTIFLVPMFSAHYNFGRIDEYCFMISLFAATLIILDKAVWLCIPLSALGVMFHQGNVFMYLNIILVLLIYRILSTTPDKRKKYIIIFALSFIVASVLFLYFELFSHFNGENIYEDIVNKAHLLCETEKIHDDVIDHEILGIDLTDREVDYHWMNAVQFPIYLIFISPYIVIAIMLFKALIKNSKEKVDKFKYIILAIGAVTILPDMLFKVDFGRWVFAVVAYYAVVILAVISMGDKNLITQINTLTTKVKNNIPGAILLLVYPIILQPLMDVSICPLVASLAGKLNDAFLHLW